MVFFLNKGRNTVAFNSRNKVAFCFAFRVFDAYNSRALWALITVATKLLITVEPFGLF